MAGVQTGRDFSTSFMFVLLRSVEEFRKHAYAAIFVSLLTSTVLCLPSFYFENKQTCIWCLLMHVLLLFVHTHPQTHTP